MIQESKSVLEYEIKLKDLVNFISELAGTVELLCSKIEEGLSLSIHEKIAITETQTISKWCNWPYELKN